MEFQEDKKIHVDTSEKPDFQFSGKIIKVIEILSFQFQNGMSNRPKRAFSA